MKCDPQLRSIIVTSDGRAHRRFDLGSFRSVPADTPRSLSLSGFGSPDRSDQQRGEQPQTENDALHQPIRSLSSAMSSLIPGNGVSQMTEAPAGINARDERIDINRAFAKVAVTVASGIEPTVRVVRVNEVNATGYRENLFRRLRHSDPTSPGVARVEAEADIEAVERLPQPSRWIRVAAPSNSLHRPCSR